MSAETTLPLDLAPLREGAEKMAREAHDLFARLTWGVSDGWSELDDDAQETLIEVHSTLLRDLTRDDTRDWWARWLARHHGLTVGATAPSWHYDEGGPGHIERDCEGGATYQEPWVPDRWIMWGEDGNRVFARWDEDGPPPPPSDEVDVWLTEWSTDPAAALRLAILAAAGRTEHANPAGGQTGAVASPESPGDDGTRAPADRAQDGESGGGRAGEPDPLAGGVTSW